MAPALTNSHLPQKAHLTPAEVARFLGISIRQIYEWISEDSLPFIRLGRVIRIPRDEFESWYAALRQSGN